MFVNKASDILSTYSSDKNVEATRASMFLRRYKFTDKKRLLLNEIVFSENSDVAKAKKEAGEKKKEKEEKKEREREKEKEKKEKKTTETKKKKYSKKK
jgi:ribosomal protein L12E/L44/L45/RPP1/RPP2